MTRTVNDRARVLVLLDSANDNLSELQCGEDGAVYRNDPVFMAVVEEVEAALRLLRALD